MNIAKRAAKALMMLGDTPQEIAANLKGAGFTGKQKDALECPCGSCLSEHFEEDVWVEIRWVSAGEYCGAITGAISQFIDMFDQGRFPSLIRKDDNG